MVINSEQSTQTISQGQLRCPKSLRANVSCLPAPYQLNQLELTSHGKYVNKTQSIVICHLANKSNFQSPVVQNGGNYHVDYKNRTMVFSSVPFFKDHLKQQIEAAGGTVYSNFENVSANKFRSCYLLAPFPCTTAKYVQCLASNIPVSF